jgi:hypothetical protein
MAKASQNINKLVRRIFKTIFLNWYFTIIKHIGQYKNSFKDKTYFKIRKNKKIWNFPILKIKEILIKIKLFKINYNNLVDFQKITEGIKFNIKLWKGVFWWLKKLLN